ncbi:ABC transporter substrate-binding protein [Pseudoalteromonas ulvae]|uniref:ABC transporter substrate-binding protein n=1 Tax=Pseudoalteromonas ulvae TaxID=107327 RepID=UPI00186B9BE7|nr:ABC transporter substrate-binding protein [Pseudoalteromonas ulvae]
MRLLLFIFFSATTFAQPLKINIVSDVIQAKDISDLDMSFELLLQLTEPLIASNAIEIEFIPASRLREWRELTNQSNVCLYNKVKTPEREHFGIFTDYPITAFPPNRLAVHSHLPLPEQLSLPQTMNDFGLTIGAIEGRAYGQHIDQFLLDNHDRIIWISGKDSAKRLRKMLIRKKVDAIIEFTATFSTESEADLAALTFHKLDEASESIFGYIACARSSVGQQAIDLFNGQLALPSNQKIIIDAHYASFFNQEAQYIAEDIKKKFDQPSSR